MAMLETSVLVDSKFGRRQLILSLQEDVSQVQNCTNFPEISDKHKTNW
jgi:hypothetical protein